MKTLKNKIKERLAAYEKDMEKVAQDKKVIYKLVIAELKLVLFEIELETLRKKGE